MIRQHKGDSILADVSDYVSIDLETTGLDPAFDSIIELGAIKVQDDKIVDRYTQLINPGFHIPSFITDITGIDDSMVDDSPALQDRLLHFLEWLGPNSIVVGHNVNFDINFLYDSAQKLFDTPVGNDFIDTLRLSRRLFPQEKHNRLSDLITRFGIASIEQHRALSDAEQTAACYDWMRHYISDNSIVFPEDARTHNGKSPVFRKMGALTTVLPAEHISHNPMFEDQIFVFTGTLSRMLRKDAQQAVVNNGGIIGKGVTKATNYLVIGTTEYCASLKGAKSSKQKKAETLRADGNDLTIISEDVFYDMLGDSLPDAQDESAAQDNPSGHGTMWSKETVPANPKPEGIEEVIHEANIDVLHSQEHADQLARYGKDTWVWVVVKKSIIPQGGKKGVPTLTVELDGISVGWISAPQAELEMPLLSSDTALAKGFIKQRKSGLVLLVYLPFPE